MEREKIKGSLNFCADSYNKNSKYYDKTYFFLNDYKGEADFIKKILRLNKIKLNSAKFLDLGCGTGNLFFYLPQLKKVGIDLSSGMIEGARIKNIPRSSFFIQDISKLNLRHKFDIIYISTFLIQTFKSFKEIEKFLDKIKINLSEEGIIIFSWINEEEYKKKYNDGNFQFELKDGWNCLGESYFRNKKRCIKLEFIKGKKIKIKSYAENLIFSEKYLEEISRKLNMNVQIYSGKRNGLKEEYHKWAILKRP